MKPEQKKTITLIAIGVIVIIAAIFAYKYFYNGENRAVKELNALDQSSAPVTQTPKQRVDTLEGLREESKPVNQSPEERLRLLEQSAQ